MWVLAVHVLGMEMEVWILAVDVLGMEMEVWVLAVHVLVTKLRKKEVPASWYISLDNVVR